MQNKEDIICPRCKVEMVIGKAIDPIRSNCVIYWFAPPSLTNETLKIIDCLKCPSCGFSDDGTVQISKPEYVPNVPTDNSHVIDSVVKFYK